MVLLRWFLAGTGEFWLERGVTGPITNAVAPTHKTPGQRPKPRLADETNGLFLCLGALLGHQRTWILDRGYRGRSINTHSRALRSGSST